MLRFLAAAAAFAASIAHGQVVVRDLSSRPDVTVRIAYARAANPVASAVLFQGGGGNVGIYPNGTMNWNNQFLSGAGALDRFTANDISVAVVDAPSDRRDLNGGFRASLEHAEDAAAVIAFLRTESSLPVWAIGTSNGSLSAANAAVRLGPRGPNGIVLTSATTSHAPNPSLTHLVTDASLAEIGVPVLWVHHRIDECKHTPFDAIPPLVASMKKAARADLIPVEGGDNSPRGNRSTPCSSGYHQFQGIEAEVTKRIADWIKKEQGAK